MDKVVLSLLMEQGEPGTDQTTRDVLTRAATILQAHLRADLVIGYELIPETGGVPRLPPICVGELIQPDRARQILASVSATGILADFIRYGGLYHEADAEAWRELSHDRNGPLDYTHVIEVEEIKSFHFLPFCHRDSKLAVLFLNYRDHVSLSEENRAVLTVCASLVGARLAEMSLRPQDVKKRKAIAHTLYGSVAAIFKMQIDALEAEIVRVLGENLPPPIVAHLQLSRHAMFQMMRDLVIEAPGELLVDLDRMSLGKALITTAAALKRAQPMEHTITIDIPPVPMIIECQPSRLRHLLYTFILEAIGNAMKHGGPAPYIHVDLSWSENRVYVQVIDHGKGFNRAERPLSAYGLGFWQEYIVQHLAGTFDISSQVGYGTVVRAEIPVIPARSEHGTKDT